VFFLLFAVMDMPDICEHTEKLWLIIARSAMGDGWEAWSMAYFRGATTTLDCPDKTR
jgi:hypothetical protein